MRELDWFVKMADARAGAEGGYADIVAEGDPLANITAVSKKENVRWVMKAGRVVVDKTKRTE